MNKVIPTTLPPETITRDAIWAHLTAMSSKPKPMPIKYVLEAVFDEFMVVADGKRVDEIVDGLKLGESTYINLPKKLSSSEKEEIYIKFTESLKGLFPGVLPFIVEASGEIAKIYYQQRFIMQYGLPPYVEGKVNMPESKKVKRPKAKVQHNCPECGHCFTDPD